ncbi:efflux RND transporter permease subunit [Gammaproteobacteria bacterium]|nr:efflux RND transporter permease subunit [Gammaproteobacteria bacterium]
MLTAIRWFANNSVAANLLMIMLLVGGALSLAVTNQEEFPMFDIPVVRVGVPYLGAAPVEVEKSVCVRIEEAIEGVEGIDRTGGAAVEGYCNIMAEIAQGADQTVVLGEIKSRVDGINSFPVETEKPIVSKIARARLAIQIALSGNTDERTLKELARELRDDLARVRGISTVSVGYTRPYEISIEVSEQTLQEYGLTLNNVASAIRASSFDMPGGTIRSTAGEILIRTTGQAYVSEEFADVVVMTRPDGTRLLLGDIADIRDTFEEGFLIAEFDGARAATINVSQVETEDLMSIVENTKRVVGQFESTLPEGLKTTIWINGADDLQERMSVLTRSAAGGLVLVLVILALFLEFKLAMWVAIGIPVALMGAIAVLPATDINISTLTVMGFILVLGIVVDDAIVVGERVYGHEQMGKSRLNAAIDGTWEVSTPVIFGVLTTIAAFLPLVMVRGQMADFFSPIGWIVIFALFFSIIESQLILPSHLVKRGRQSKGNALTERFKAVQHYLGGSLEHFATQTYRPFLEKVITWRYATGAICLGALIVALSMILSGRVVFGFFPAVEGDRVYAELEMPEGVSANVTLEAARRIERASDIVSQQLTAELGLENPIAQHTLVSVGTKSQRSGPGNPFGGLSSNIAEVVIDLAPLAERGDISAKIFANRWRDAVGGIPDAVNLTFDADKFGTGSPLEYQMRGEDVDELRLAAEELKGELSKFDGVFDISDSWRVGKQEIQLDLLPEARNLGLTLNDLATQVRAAFYGAEAQRVARGKDDVRVMVRFPEAERKSISNLEDMYIRTPNGSEVPFYSVADFSIARGYSAIDRRDGQRNVFVSADVDRSSVAPEEVSAAIRNQIIPSFQQRYPGIDIQLGGEQEERADALGGLAIGSLLSLILIYSLLAIPLKSYVQPLIIMSVIPFGAVGAIAGHYVLDQQLVFFSALGLTALSGVVVNASLVLVDYANKRKLEGKTPIEAILGAASIRFRPIILTSVTTFVGLIPLMSTSTPATAPFLPMVISLAWGVLFATVITLMLVPCLYIIIHDFVREADSSEGEIGGLIEEPQSAG